MTSFSDQVRVVVKGIPSGSVMTYQEVATAAGNPAAARAVMSWLKILIPIYRVTES